MTSNNTVMRTRFSLFILLPAILVEVIQSFSPQSSIFINERYSTTTTTTSSSSINTNKRMDFILHATGANSNTGSTREKNFLMDDFRTADGQIINPYKTLKIDRKAPHTDIRQSYRKLSKKYHPDACRFRTIMPGKCNNLDDVRDEWERINLSYEILSDKKTRKKYDRQSALNDPGVALGRVALDTVGWGMSGLAKGVFFIGKQAVNAATKKGEVDTAASAAVLHRNRGDGHIVKLSKGVERKKRMVQHIHVEAVGGKTTSNDNENDGVTKGTYRARPMRQRQHTVVAAGAYPSLAIVGYSVKKNRTNFLEDILALGASFVSARAFFPSSDIDFNWSLEMPTWLQEIQQTAFIPLQENLVNAVEKFVDHFFENI